MLYRKPTVTEMTIIPKEIALKVATFSEADWTV